MRNHDANPNIGSSMRRRAALRSIFAGMIMLSASSAMVHAAGVARQAGSQSGYGYVLAAAGHRQPTRDDVKGADEVPSDENGLAKRIDEENARVDRLLRGICRGC
jgi:hypothetical protein